MSNYSQQRQNQQGQPISQPSQPLMTSGGGMNPASPRNIQIQQERISAGEKQ